MKSIRQKNSDRSAFTLVELLVVIGIIGMLIALLLPTLATAQRHAQSIVCRSNMNQNYKMMYMYADTPGNGMWLFPSKLGANISWADYPTIQRWVPIVFGEPNPASMICPADQEIGANDLDPRDKHSYIANKHLIYNQIRPDRVGQSKIADKSQIIVMGEKKSIYRDYYMEVDNYGTTNFKSDYDRLVELNRHGLQSPSNLLFLDGHVSNELPDAPKPDPLSPLLSTDPWDPSAQSGNNAGG